jgi:hypothetical protein
MNTAKNLSKLLVNYMALKSLFNFKLPTLNSAIIKDICFVSQFNNPVAICPKDELPTHSLVDGNGSPLTFESTAALILLEESLFLLLVFYLS